jgi:hypothetical protein
MQEDFRQLVFGPALAEGHAHVNGQLGLLPGGGI